MAEDEKIALSGRLGQCREAVADLEAAPMFQKPAAAQKLARETLTLLAMIVQRLEV